MCLLRMFNFTLSPWPQNSQATLLSINAMPGEVSLVGKKLSLYKDTLLLFWSPQGQRSIHPKWDKKKKKFLLHKRIAFEHKLIYTTFPVEY